MPHELTAVLAALAAEASPGDFAPAERLLGGSFSGLADVRRNHVAKIDAAELHVAWIAERLGAQMNCAAFAANVADLWFPATDDVACVLYSAGQLLVLVLDHEELITLSRLGASQAVRHPGQVLWMAGSSCCSPWFATGRPCAMPAARCADQRTLQTAGRRDGPGRADRAGASRVRPPGARGHRLPLPLGCCATV